MKKKERYIFPYFWKYKKNLFFYIVLLFLAAVLCFWASVQAANFLNNLSVGETQKAYYTLLLMTAIPIVFIIIYHVAQMIYYKTSAKIALDIKKDLAHRILKISHATMERASSGTVITRITNDPENIINSLDMFVTRISDLLISFLSVVYITVLNWIVGIAVALTILILITLEIIRAKFFYKNNKITKKLAEPATSLTSEMVRSQKDIKSLGIEDAFEEKFYKNYQNYINIVQKTQFVNENWFRVRRIATELLVNGIILLALFLLDQGIMALGVVLYVFTSRSSIGTVVNLFGNLTHGLAMFKVSKERIEEIYDDKLYPIEYYGDKEVKNLTSSIEFDKVGFSYVEKMEKTGQIPPHAKKKKKQQYEYIKHKVFENLSFKIEPNTTVAFVGISGSGKSTILNLMAKLADAESGKILLGGYDIQELSKKTIRDNMVLITQFPYVFDMTLRDNILLAKPDASDEDVLKACQDANLLNYVNKLPGGISTIVGENGVKMSGGEKQRLAIARALIKNTPIIIFDESTSSLDNIAQAEVTKSINKLSGNQTVIIVAHRLSTIKNVDKIYFLEKGKIVDQGTFEELNKTNEKFKAIFKAENLEMELDALKEKNNIE